MPERAPSDPQPAGAPASQVFKRLLKLLRPYWGMIALGLLLLIVA